MTHPTDDELEAMAHAAEAKFEQAKALYLETLDRAVEAEAERDALEAALAKADELAEATWRGPSNRYIVEAREAYRQVRDALRALEQGEE